MGRQARQSSRLQREEGEDFGRFDEGRIDEEQDGQDWAEGGVCTSQEAVREKCSEEVDGSCQGSTQTAQHHRILCCEWKVGAREGVVCQGQVHSRIVRALLLLGAGSHMWTFHLCKAVAPTEGRVWEE